MKFDLDNEKNSGLAQEGAVLAVGGQLTFNTNLIASNGKVAATTQALTLQLQPVGIDAEMPKGLTETQAATFLAEKEARTEIANAFIKLKAYYDSLPKEGE